ncbi:type II toxin-antitoxin system Phd/YefM family antitoxin [Acinetobacter puyangensis]|uniref:type II toxin-antitoxin system Phd/YefM family antitoxin n=1 Tax=Acinetobacter puyangensis TaxID=1096779 RepID=UPI003A4D9158
MHTWSVQDAKARFSELLESCAIEGTQVITKRGVETAVLVPIDEWKRLTYAAKPTLKELLLQQENHFELELPVRGQAKRRKTSSLD